MSRSDVRRAACAAMLFLSAAVAWSQGFIEEESCTYTLQTNGPVWDRAQMRIPWDVSAVAWAHDGAYGGGGLSKGEGLHSGGAGVAVAQTTLWFRLTHNADPTCVPVAFDSQALLSANVSTRIKGDSDDYALAAGFQAVTGLALQAASVAVAATNAGSPVQGSVLSLSFGLVNFSMTLPGVSVTADTVDSDSNSTFTFGQKKIEEEIIALHCWTKTKVVTDGPFGGIAWSSVNSTSASASTTSTCAKHQVTGSYSVLTTEG
jgi:hypothetical protein